MTPKVDRRSLFASTFGPPAAAPVDAVDADLMRRCAQRLKDLEQLQPLNGLDLKGLLLDHGIGRRRFLEWVSATTALLMLPPVFEPMVAKAATVTNRVPVIWIEGQDCAGNSEALLHAVGPNIDEILFNVISLEYHEVVMAASGFQADERKKQAAAENKGKYILVVEGSIPRGANGGYMTIGPNATPFIDEVRALAKDAAAVIGVGSCAFYGGVAGAKPNPTDAVGVADIVKGTPVVNLPACPMNPVNFNGTLLHFTLTGNLPALDSQLRPKFAYGYRVHDNCERRAHFDAGEYVHQWGDEGARHNYCLYKMGCKGPMTWNNCSIVRYNEGTNWPIGSGHGCIGCAEKDFWDRYANERPVASAAVNFPGLFGGGVEGDIDRLGRGLVVAATVGIAAHAALTAGATVRRKRGTGQPAVVGHAAAGAVRHPSPGPTASTKPSTGTGTGTGTGTSTSTSTSTQPGSEA